MIPNEYTRKECVSAINAGINLIHTQSRSAHPKYRLEVQKHLGFGFWVLGFGFGVLGFGVWGLGFMVRVLGLRVWGLELGVWGLGVEM